MPVFQIGVKLIEERITDMLVRVNAPDLLAARKLALRLAAPKVNEARHPRDLLENDPDWESGDLSLGGISEADYSDMGPLAYPDADLDFTDQPEQPLAPDPRQTVLPGTEEP